MGSMPLLEQPHYENEDHDAPRLKAAPVVPPRVIAAGLARDAASHCALRPQSPTFTHLDDGPYDSTELLSLLTFAYGTGVFSLERIYDLIEQDILCRSFISGRVPHPDTLRRFRQLERKTLQSALDQFFHRVVAMVDQELTNFGERRAFLSTLGLHTPVPTCDLRRHRMVVDRVNQATWVDRMMDF